MTTWSAGDVVIVPFPGDRESKIRPAVVVSSDLYHRSRPDVVLSLLTGQVAKANLPTDYILADWQAARLRFPTAFRVYVTMVPAGIPRRIGRLSDRDWAEAQARLRLALAVS